jgi:hypothetical protein
VTVLVKTVKQRRKVLDKTTPRKIFGPKKVEDKEDGKNYVMRNFMIGTPRRILSG